MGKINNVSPQSFALNTPPGAIVERSTIVSIIPRSPMPSGGLQLSSRQLNIAIPDIAVKKRPGAK